MSYSRRGTGRRVLVLVVATLLVAAPLAAGVAIQSTAAASGGSDPVVKFAYVDTDTGNLTLVTASGTKIDMGVKPEIIGAAKDMDDDYYVEVPYVTSNGGLFVIDRSGEKKQLASNARSSGTKLVVADLDGDDTRAVFYANTSKKLVKVTYSGSPQAVGGGLSALSAVGVADLTGDGVPEILFVGTSSGYFHYYNGSSNVGMGFGPNNPGEVGAPRDFNGDGIPRIPYVDGSNNVEIAYVNGTTKQLTGGAEKLPVAAVNWTGDSRLEVLYVSGSANNRINYVTLGGNTGEVVTDALESIGVAWVQDTSKPFSVSNFTVTNESGTLRVSFDASEELQNTTVEVSGPDGVTLHRPDFTETVSDGTYTYVANYTPNADGTYNGTLQRAESVDGDVVKPDLTDGAVIDTRFDIDSLNVSVLPDHDLDIAFNASEKLSAVTVTVSGAESATLDLSNFSTSDASAPYTYTGTYDGSSDGTYEVTVDSGTSQDGQTDDENLTETVTVDQDFGVWNFTLTNESGKLQVSFKADEELGATNVTVDGPSDRTLHLGDFTENQTNGAYRYVATYTPNADGTFNGTLRRAESWDGQVVTPDLTDGAVVERGFTLWNLTVSVTGDGDLRIGFNASDDVATVSVSVTGPEDATLDRSAFTQVASSPNRYVATYDVTTDATWTVTVSRATSTSDQVFDDDLTASETRDVLTPVILSVELAETTNADGIVGESDSVTVTADVRGDVDTVTADLSGFDAGTVVLTRQADGTYTATVDIDDLAPDGSHAATVTASDGQGNVVTETTGEVTVDTTPPTLDFGSNLTVTAGSSVELSPQSASDATTFVTAYRWAFGTGETATGRTVTYTYSSPGTYTVTLTVVDAAGNTASDQLVVNVEPASTTTTQTTTRTTQTTTRTTQTTTQVQRSTMETTRTTTQTTTGESPGFGVAVTVVALVAFASLAVRRAD